MTFLPIDDIKSFDKSDFFTYCFDGSVLPKGQSFHDHSFTDSRETIHEQKNSRSINKDGNGFFDESNSSQNISVKKDVNQSVTTYGSNRPIWNNTTNNTNITTKTVHDTYNRYLNVTDSENIINRVNVYNRYNVTRDVYINRNEIVYPTGWYSWNENREFYPSSGWYSWNGNREFYPSSGWYSWNGNTGGGNWGKNNYYGGRNFWGDFALGALSEFVFQSVTNYPFQGIVIDNFSPGYTYVSSYQVPEFPGRYSVNNESFPLFSINP